MQSPRNGITTEARIVEVIDGDTVEVEVCRRFKVRLSHPSKYKTYIFDTPEKGTLLGDAAKKYVRDLVEKHGGSVKVFIPSNGPLELMDMNSFNRLIGEIWLDDKRLTQILIDEGYGRIISKSKRTSTPWKEKTSGKS